MAILKHIASSVESVLDLFRSGDEFELSQDGESLYGTDDQYDFVGFTSPDGGYITREGDRLYQGRCLGKVINDDSRKVYLLEGGSGIYIMLQNISDTSEVYVLRA